MEQKIYKYPIQLTDQQIIHLPLYAKIISAQLQNGVICLWAILDPEAVDLTRRIVIAGTGHPMPDLPLRFIDTVQDGSFVWHVFEEIV